MGNSCRYMAVLASCVGLLWASELSARAGEPPDVFELIVAPSVPGNWRNSEGDILDLADGRLLLAWTDFYGPEEDECDCKPARISAMTSVDMGHTWGKRFTLQENIGKQNVMEPSLLRLRSGKILFVFGRKDSKDAAQPMVRVSFDGGETFSPPKEIPVVPHPSYTGLNDDRVIQLKSGRILVPAFFIPDFNGDHRIRSRIYYSDDEGNTWTPSRTIIDVKDSKAGAQEPGVVELKDGRVMLWARTSTGTIYQAYSSDQGETWSTPEPMGISAPVSPASIKRIPTTGDLLLVWNNSPKYRFPLTVAISKDDGQTWQHVKNLEDAPCCTYAYTSITFVKDRCLLTYYADAGTPPGQAPPKPKKPSAIPGAWVANWSLKLKSVPVRWFYQ